MIVVHTLDRLGRTVRDTLNLIHELAERGVGVGNLADPIRVASSNPADPMAQLAVVLLALFGQMERTYTLETYQLAGLRRETATSTSTRPGTTSLVHAAEDWLIGVGAPKVQLMVRVDNHQVAAFYRQLGYGSQDVLVLGRRLD